MSDPERDQKIALACYVAEQWHKGPPEGAGTGFFVGPGTAAAFAGLELLGKHTTQHIYTNLAPFSWHVMELLDLQILGGTPMVHMLEGKMDPTTGVLDIELKKSQKDVPLACFIYSPYSINRDFVIGHSNRDALKAIWRASQGVILLGTFEKLVRESDRKSVVKHAGKIKEAIKGKKKKPCFLIVPQNPPKELKTEQIERAELELKKLQEHGITVLRAPNAPKDSLVGRYIEHLIKRHGDSQS